MSTQYVNRAELPKDYLSGDIFPGVASARVLASATITASAASTPATALGAVTYGQEVVSVFPVTTPVWAAFGTVPVATVGGDHYCPADTVTRFLVPAGLKLALIDA